MSKNLSFNIPVKNTNHFRRKGVDCIITPTQGEAPSAAEDAYWSNLQVVDGVLFIAAQV